MDSHQGFTSICRVGSSVRLAGQLCGSTIVAAEKESTSNSGGTQSVVLTFGHLYFTRTNRGYSWLQHRPTRVLSIRFIQDEYRLCYSKVDLAIKTSSRFRSIHINKIVSVYDSFLNRVFVCVLASTTLILLQNQESPIHNPERIKLLFNLVIKLFVCLLVQFT